MFRCLRSRQICSRTRQPCHITKKYLWEISRLISETVCWLHFSAVQYHWHLVSRLLICKTKDNILAKYATEKTKPVFAAVTAVRMVPPVAMVIPFFLIIRNIHLSDTLLGLIITYIPFELTLIIWMLKNFFGQIPREVEEAAELDGLSAWGILLKVVLPMSKSSVGVAGLMAFLFSWNEFMFALSLTSTKSAQTLTVGIAGYVTSFQTFWGSMSATGILFMIPAFILTFIFQKDLVKGLTAGAVKG